MSRTIRIKPKTAEALAQFPGTTADDKVKAALDQSERFILINPYGGVYLFDTQGQATEFAISANKQDQRHPAFTLWCVRRGPEAHPVGTLWRTFGQDFDPSNCWSPR